jgi:NADPH:quinone reductase-like Zn-dependent oxidoreductase
VILDNMGGSYLQRNLDCLSVDGRLFIIGFQGGPTTQVNLSPMLAKRLTVQGCLISLIIFSPRKFLFELI